MTAPYDLQTARTWAAKVLNELAPFCRRIEIAGSIRRECPQVNDIDLVAIPRDFNGLRERLQRNAEVLTDGLTNLLVRLKNGVEIDLFLARPEERELFGTTPTNWGTLMICRTGSADFNIALARRALARGQKWNPYQGVLLGGRLIASRTEEDVFRALDLPPIPPRDRTGDHPLFKA